MTPALESLVNLLALEEIERNIYRGANEAGGRTRLFGGQVMAQALAAAGRTVEGRAVHSLHGYFLRPGDPSIPIVFTVDRIRDGGSFTTRSVVAVQRGEAIFELSASFHNPEPGFEHGDPMPDAPAPETLPTWEERVRLAGDRIPAEARPWMLGERPIDVRSTQGMSMFGGKSHAGPNYVWMRANGTLPEDPFLHACIATYASDMSLLDSIVRRHVGGMPFRTLMMASLDHALWFHRPFRMDEWQLYVQESPAAGGGRGFARGTIYARDGRLVASVAQEGLMRPIPKGGAARKEGESR
jgi:acyl-CoA thioesterase-2